MRTYVGTLVTLDTLGAFPDRSGNCNASLLVGGCTKLELAVNVIHESGDWKAVAIHFVDRI